MILLPVILFGKALAFFTANSVPILKFHMHFVQELYFDYALPLNNIIGLTRINATGILDLAMLLCLIKTSNLLISKYIEYPRNVGICIFILSNYCPLNCDIMMSVFLITNIPF